MEAAAQPCPSCGYANRPGKKFCGGCGSPLLLRCPSCNTDNPPGARFCDECGSPLTGAAAPAGAPASPPVPSTHELPPLAVAQTVEPVSPVRIPAPTAATPAVERRLVTALFCDLVGFTPLSELLDPEEVREIQADYFGRMSAEIDRYGGTVQKYAGDAVLAFFGAPIAHGDDAERAVLCGLAMQAAIRPVAVSARERWGVEPAIRVGVNTGEVVSGVWNVGGRQDVDVTGDAINTAARFQAAADPGEVLVGAETMRLTRRRIRYGDRRDLVLKGKTRPVPGYPALGVSEQFGERAQLGQHLTTLVGREQEMAQVLAAWALAERGKGQLVTLSGDVGVGKSRLAAEAIARASERKTVRLIAGRCLSYGQEISLWLVAEILRSLLGVDEQDTGDAVAAKLRAGVADLLAGHDAETQSEALDVMGEILGLPLTTSALSNSGAQIRRHALVRALRLVLEESSQLSPILIELEDVQWIDPASADVLQEVLIDVPELRVLVLVARRTGWTAPWDSWEWTQVIELPPLADADAAKLAAAVLGGKRLALGLQAYVAERAAGNPFFVEEVVRALQETGNIVEQDGELVVLDGAAERLPATLTELLQARLDRLAVEVRGVAQVASVIGSNFAVQLLARILHEEVGTLDPALSVLQRAEIVFPLLGIDVEYGFKHVSLREVAYNTLLQKRRRELHLETARAVAALYPGDDYVEMIAYHYTLTDAHAEAAVWLERAGDRAASIYASDTAIGNFQEALRRLEKSGEQAAARARLDEKQGAVLYTAGRYDEALEPLVRAAEAYRSSGDLEGAGRATALVGMAHRYRGTPEDGIGPVERMLEALEEIGPSQAVAALRIAQASLLFLTGKYRETLAAAEEAARISRVIGDERLLGEAEERRGTALLLLGDPNEALLVLERALPLVEAGGDFVVLWRALNNAATVCEKLGRMDRVRTYTERALEVAERMGNPSRTAFILANLGSTLITLGDWQAARTELDRAMKLALSAGRAADAAIPLQYLGQLNLWQGEMEDAGRRLREGLILAREAGDRQNLEMVQAFFAELDLIEERPDSALTRLEKLVQREDATLSLLLPILSWAYLALGKTDRALEVSQEAVERTRERGEQYHSVQALWAHAMVLIRRGELDTARSVLEEGLELARSMPFPYMEARLLHQDGILRMAQSDPATAHERLERAARLFRQLGARLDMERVEQELVGSIAERAFRS